jgi:heat shock protein HslJ
MKTRTLIIIVSVLGILAVLAVAALVYASRQGSAAPAATPAPTETAAPQPITGILWEWTGMQDSQGSTSVSDPRHYTITFKDDGSVTIQADCNQVSGSYSMSGSSVTIQLGASTTAYCGEGSQDQVYLASLSKVSSYAVDQKGLELHFSDGKMDFRDGGPAG